ncbi:ABC transporter transmembrane domain-containing protein [Sorangium sp. So ce448]|uniref:ABC transporter transmembrane domain-containing protein n=1 Tax=Sorangium sp. So ce448 TaxID=3133314 RepID=UPI003F5E56EE
MTQASGAGRAALSGRLRDALALFVALIAGEFLFSRIAGLCQILVGPWQRQNVTRNLYAYLQHHSHRYFSNNFAGALAHRISETSMGVSQTLWAILFDFWPIAIVFSVSFGLLYRAHPALAAVVSAWAALFVGISYWLATRCQPHAVRAASARSITEQAIQDTLDDVMKGKTVLVVAHRLSTVVHLDRILVFEDGRIIEDGTHAELLARNGAYKRLWSKQSDGFLPESAADAPAAMEAPQARVHEAPRLQPAADRADELPRGAPLKAWEAPLA